MGSLVRGWRLTKTSWRILRADKELAAFTTVGALCTLVAALLFVLPALAVAAAYLGLLFIIASALGQILRSAIYLYAETWQVPAQFDAGLIQHAFKSKAA